MNTGSSWEDVLKCTGTRLVMVHKPYLPVLASVGSTLFPQNTDVTETISFIIKVETESNTFSSS